MKRPLTPRCLVYLVEYNIEGEWQTDGEWFVVRAHALAQARYNKEAFGWPWRLLRASVKNLDAVRERLGAK